MTENTDIAAVREHELGEQHLAGAMALSHAANWNQNEADWRMMLRLGKGFGLSAADGSLIASIVVLPYGDQFAWMSMVLVSPLHRRRGYASRMLRRALGYLQARGLVAVLDATPAGHEVYVQEGLRDAWGFRRYSLAAARPVTGWQDVSGLKLRHLMPDDWPQILALDLPAFGASREALLRALAARLPEAALVVQRGERICGYLFGRDGREARQLGPLVAQDLPAAQALLSHVLASVAAPVYMDIVDHHTSLRSWVLLQGFTVQRPFTRMVYGAESAPGNNETVMLVAGPELG
ncbi:MAG: GNAT family N-acetyltransferase [Burkholderiales bacterium]